MTTSSSTGVAIAKSTVLSVTWPEACSLPLPGGTIGPRSSTTSGVAMTLASSQIVAKRRAWLGSPPALPGAAAGSDDIDEPAHVAERLHRAAVSEVEARGAGHEALPAVAALLGSAEAEGDRAVVAREFAGCFFAGVLGFFGDPGEGYEDAELRHRERVRGFFGVDRLHGLAVDRGRRPHR